MSKKRPQKQKKEVLFRIILLVVIFILFFIYQQKSTVKNIDSSIDSSIDNSEEINLSQYKLATFSDSFSGESWTDMEKTSLVFNQREMSFVFPDLERDLIGSLSEDLKSQKQPQQVVSLKINFDVNKIKAVQIDKSENSEINSQIQYFLSNDGGANWIDTDIGSRVYFQEIGNDLRWQAIISPLAKSTSKTKNSSKISSINITYWYER